MQSRRLLILGFVLAMGVLWTVASADMKVLFYEYEKSPQHFFNVTKKEVPQAGGEQIKYELTTDAQKGLKLDNLKKYDMVLFGTHAIGGWSTYHLEGVEEDLIAYVKEGGFILTQTNDDSFYKGDMFPVELKMRESGDHDYEVTPEGKELGIFDKPNKVGNLIEDDSYFDVEKPWVVLAKSKGTNTPHTLLLNHGIGEYVVTSTRADGNVGQAETNVPLVENVVNYFVKRVKEVRSVEPANKLATYWGAIKRD